eukprot:TRINITY_DN20755_c1_g1_i3.p3 TRINITY_DN20755_c1_g1~~TRINITY_DN20755_c1_g1_i3.p3  ORF type:complete len:122 (-),score=0.44 TRINITY_DN20755_c1_g1_i3:41-406(-)
MVNKVDADCRKIDVNFCYKLKTQLFQCGSPLKWILIYSTNYKSNLFSAYFPHNAYQFLIQANIQIASVQIPLKMDANFQFKFPPIIDQQNTLQPLQADTRQAKIFKKLLNLGQISAFKEIL